MGKQSYAHVRLNKDQLGDLKEYHQTSELRTSGLLLLAIFVAHFYIPDLAYWAAAVTLIVSSYIVSRAKFKKNRRIMMYDGFRTSEFYAYLLGILVLLVPVVARRLNPGVALLCASVIQVAFNWSRGHAKELTPNLKIQNIQTF